MANNQTRRIAPSILQSDLESFAALQAIATYAPPNPAYTLDAITTAQENMQAKQTAETQTAAALAAARDSANEAEWAFHNAILGMRMQVTAQYGENSDEVQAVGLKKKSEYKKPAKKQSGKKGSGQ
jgi:hypothetical protein